jgi:histidine triad (HIT) family protein
MVTHPTQSSCVFCKIIAREIPAKIVAETDNAIAVHDIAPRAPIHYLIIPKKHMTDVRTIESHDASIAADLFTMAQDLAKTIPGSSDFRLVINNGAGVGQSVFHLHLHFLAGKVMSDFK